MRRSSLYRLQPFLVGRRLRRAEIEYEEKAPAILLKSSHFTTLTIRHHHEKLHYQGKQITRGRILNAGIWIVGASRRISSCINQCVTCKKLRKKLQMQITQDRLEPYPHIPTWVSTLSAHGPFKQEKIERRATNFIEGHSELDEATKSLDQRTINNYLTNQNCESQFNRPRPSHFEGV